MGCQPTRESLKSISESYVNVSIDVFRRMDYLTCLLKNRTDFMFENYEIILGNWSVN